MAFIEEKPDEVWPTNWVSLNEAKWIWQHFHCDVNQYALARKKAPYERLDMEEQPQKKM